MKTFNEAKLKQFYNNEWVSIVTAVVNYNTYLFTELYISSIYIYDQHKY